MSAINTRFSWKKEFAVAQIQGRCSVKEGLQWLQCVPVNIVKFLRTPIFKSICEQLFLQNLFKMFREGFSVAVFFLSNMIFLSQESCFIIHIKWDVIISSSLRLLLKVWIWCRCQSRIENYYQSDGEQLGFNKKEGCSCNFILHVYCNETSNKKRRILIYLPKTVLKRTSKAIFSMKKVNLDES